jgi:Methyltransferase FkbM domain
MVTFSSALSKIDRTARFSRKIGIRSAIAVEMSRRAINSTQNAKLLPGDRPSQLKISDTTVSPWAYQVTESQDHVSVKLDSALKTLTISELMDAANEHEVLIAKIDIEGAEANLFRSNIEWVWRTHLVAIEFHDWMLPDQRTSTPSFDQSQISISNCFSEGKTCLCFFMDCLINSRWFMLRR